MAKIKVLHIAECAGGVERYLQLLMPLLKEYGVTQSFICSFNYKIKDYLEWNDRIEQLDLRRELSLYQLVNNILKTRRLIKIIRPDIVYCHSSLAGGIGRLAAIGLPCKVVYNPHGWAFNMR